MAKNETIAISANSVQMRIGAYAIGQIESLVAMLSRESHLEADGFPEVVRGTAARIKELIGAAYWAVTDESGNADQTAELYEVVHCRKMEADHD